MQRILFLALCCLAFSAKSQTQTDSVQIRQTALDFIEGWYAGDALRMEKSLHQDVISKLMVRRGENSQMQQYSGLNIVQMTRAGLGKQVQPKDQLKEIKIHSIFQDAASVEVRAFDGMEFLHMVRQKDGWKILNIMFEPVRR